MLYHLGRDQPAAQIGIATTDIAATPPGGRTVSQVWLIIALSALHITTLTLMWQSGRWRGRADRHRNAADGWAAASVATRGLREVYQSEDLQTAKHAALKAAVRSLHQSHTAEEIAAETGAQVELVDMLILDDADLAGP